MRKRTEASLADQTITALARSGYTFTERDKYEALLVNRAIGFGHQFVVVTRTSGTHFGTLAHMDSAITLVQDSTDDTVYGLLVTDRQYEPGMNLIKLASDMDIIICPLTHLRNLLESFKTREG